MADQAKNDASPPKEEEKKAAAKKVKEKIKKN